jgi:hypothetical protein
MSGEGATVAGDTTAAGIPSATVPTEAVAATPWYARFFAWFKKAAKKVYELVMPGVIAGITAFLNDPDNQALAVAAVKAAIDQGLRGQNAWVTARDVLVAQLQKSGKEASTTVIDTILQNAYCVTKYSVASADPK